jgi:hypothetical protein
MDGCSPQCFRFQQGWLTSACIFQVPHDQPLVAQAMIEQWVDAALDKETSKQQTILAAATS